MGGLLAPGGARPPERTAASCRRLSWLPSGSPFSFRLGQLSRAGGLNAQPGREHSRAALTSRFDLGWSRAGASGV